MNKYKVVWEVSKFAYIEANSAEEACEQVLSGEVVGSEDEMTCSPDALEVNL